MNKKISVLLALALTVSALSGCNMASGKNPDDLRVDRDGGDHKHEYGEVSETSIETTAATTTEETTEATTTTTTTQATSISTWDTAPVSSFKDVCEMSTYALNYDIDTTYGIVENAFATKFTYDTVEYHSASEDDYDEDLYIFFYNCDIVIDGVHFDAVNFCCHQDMRVYEISYVFHSSDVSELKEHFEFCKAEYAKIFDKPTEEQTEDDYILYAAYGPENGVVYSTYYMYWGEDSDYNVVILGFDLA